MSKPTSFLVICPICEDSIGTVTEVEEQDRKGFYTNKSEPKEIPGRCPTCDSFVARVPNYI